MMDTVRKILVALLFGVIMLAMGARFIALEADFPWGFTWEGAPYTDEGWYSYSAVMHEITGHWYVPGDYNAIIFRPTFHILLMLAFKMLGLGLLAARSVVVICYLGIIIFTALLVRKYLNPQTALLTALLLSVNYTLFVYSRLAISEIPTACLGLLSLSLLLYFPQKRYLGVEILATLTLFLTILTKESGIPFVLAFLYAVAIRYSSWKQRILVWTAVSAILTGLFSIRHMIGMLWFREDYSYFGISILWGKSPTTEVVTSRFKFDLLFMLNNLSETLWNGMFLDRLMYPLAIGLLFFPIVFLLSKQYRRNALIIVCILWIGSYFGALNMSDYQPPRYYLTLIAPLTVLFSLTCISFYHALKPSLWVYLPITMVSLIVATNISNMISYLWQPQYSFVNMAQDIQAHIQLDTAQEPFLIGDIANSISLTTGIPSLNDGLGTRDLKWKLSEYTPTHYVSLGIFPEVNATLEEVYEVKEVAVYDVFNNYYRGKRVHFYKLIPKRSQ